MDLKHIIQQGDFVMLAVFILLFLMSVASWYVIIWKSIKLRFEYRAYSDFCKKYASKIDWPKHHLPKKFDGCINSLLLEIERLKPALVGHNSEEKKEIITTHLSQNLDIIRFWLDRGLTILASIGSSAPFVGLFGTVWGIYNALAKISLEGNAGLSVVAGPVGEALIMTAFGLFAAIPAVLAYNAFVRSNRLLIQNLRHLAEQITVYLSISVKEK